MTGMIQWNPFREMEEMQSRISSLLSGSNDRGGEPTSLAQWAPRVDLSETDKEYVIQAELPGMKKEDVQVTYENGTLTLTGERKFEQEEKGKRYHRVECAYGSFARSFVLPNDTNPDQILAEFKDGVLHLRVPKSEKAKPKQIQVKVA